jgi:nucleoredoxin
MTDAFTSQFGEILLNSSDDSPISPSSALTGKDYVLLYFSAAWCPPCQRFTPKLIEFYNKIKSSNNIELVFCSLDNCEKDYKDYISKMPWLCMPFEAKQSKTMASKYNAEGIPHLVVVDGKTGEVITEDGTASLGEDEEGKKFPWKPKSFSEVWPSKILSSKGSDEKFLNSDTLKDKYLMLYFSAHWCPPCKAFTPTLSKAYTTLKKERSDFELVFVSSDNDEESFKDYFESMTFCAMPYEHRDEEKELSKMFGVRGIPTLTMLGPVSEESGSRPIINANVRSFIEKEEFSEFPFHKKNYGDVGGCDTLQEVKSLIIFHENGDDEEQDEVKQIGKEVSGQYKDMNILWALSSDGFVPQIRSSAKLPKTSEEAAMIIVDVADNGGYYKSAVTDITVENVKAFIENPGDRLQLE